HSAALAESSATAARGSADEAWSYANEAKQSAIAAGKDSDAADKAAKDALAAWVTKTREEAEVARKEENRTNLAALQEMEEALADAAADDDISVWDVLSGVGHTVLDVAGLVPGVGEIADLANAGWYGLEGDALNASLSAASAIPFVGWGATGAKWGKNMFRGAEAFMKAERASGSVAHIWASSKKFPSVKNALEHFKSHRGEFPELQNAKQYVEMAHFYRQAANSPKPPAGYRVWDRLDKSGNLNGYVVYEKKSNTLVSYDSGGVPKTMNRPAPKSPDNPRGFDPGRWPTLEDYLKAQGQRER
ncbi:hypothetical protein ACGF3K_35690, partial [Streptomyces sp. NPDC047980]